MAENERLWPNEGPAAPEIKMRWLEPKAGDWQRHRGNPMILQVWQGVWVDVPIVDEEDEKGQ